jgi:hypothetical protein
MPPGGLEPPTRCLEGQGRLLWSGALRCESPANRALRRLVGWRLLRPAAARRFHSASMASLRVRAYRLAPLVCEGRAHAVSPLTDDSCATEEVTMLCVAGRAGRIGPHHCAEVRNAFSASSRSGPEMEELSAFAGILRVPGRVRTRDLGVVSARSEKAFAAPRAGRRSSSLGLNRGALLLRATGWPVSPSLDDGPGDGGRLAAGEEPAAGGRGQVARR